jgi:hypothetical protein
MGLQTLMHHNTRKLTIVPHINSTSPDTDASAVSQQGM